MPALSTRLRQLTSALADPARARTAVRALRAIDHPAAVETLCVWLAAPSEVGAAVLAVHCLARYRELLVRAAFRQALASPVALVRQAALHALAPDRDSELTETLPRLLREDPAWPVRRDVVRLLAQWPEPTRWAVTIALSDPIWRVRRQAVRRLALWQRADPGLRPRLRAWLSAGPATDTRVAGAVQYLDFLAGPTPDGPLLPNPPTFAPPQWQQATWWDDDPAVLEQNLRHLSDAEVRRDLRLLSGLLTLQDGWTVLDCLRRVRTFVTDALERLGGNDDLAALVPLLDEPRHPYAAAEAAGLLERLRPEVQADVAARVLATPATGALSRNWAISHLVARVGEAAPTSEQTLPELRLRSVRRASDWTPSPPEFGEPPPPLRPLGKTGLAVTPLGVSGRYGLPEAGFAEAVAAGVNLFFWEPAYPAQTRFWRRLSAATRDRLLVTAGTFAAEPRGVRRDLDEALRQLRLDRLAVFLLFWVRSPHRLDDVLETLAAVRREGRVAAIGLSTHQRPLALAAVRDGWDVVMVRHNLAHRGAEADLLPLAAARQVGVLAFSALCHGLIPRSPGTGTPSAADAYRYSLSQPGVSACWSAPRNLDELRQNLAVLRSPTLAEDRVEPLRRFGDDLHRRNRAFLECIRWR
jgi:aryl-alcohol dehydrogenase-like predicted oxidoreductase